MMLTQVAIHHCGVYLFKGLTEPATVVQINASSLAGRKFVSEPISKKTRVVGPAQGLLCNVTLRP